MANGTLMPNYFPEYCLLEGTIGTIAFVGNLIVIVAFFKVKQIRNRTNFYIVSLSFADLFVGLIEVPSCILVRFCFIFHMLWNVSPLSELTRTMNTVSTNLDIYVTPTEESCTSEFNRTKAHIQIFLIFFLNCAREFVGTHFI